MIINIPFTGFYNSIFASELDIVEMYESEHLAESGELSEEDYAELLQRYSNYEKALQYLAKRYVSSFNEYVEREFEINLELKFESMESPREYNFTTDRIFCHISEEKILELRGQVNNNILQATIEEHLKPRSGFISFYDEFVRDWRDKEVTDWDCNELGMLLYALLNEAEITDEYTYVIYERMCENGDFDEALWMGVDTVKFDAAVAERVAELTITE